MDFETPEADAAEQDQPIAFDDEDTADDHVELPRDANPADIIDQQRAVPDDPYEQD